MGDYWRLGNQGNSELMSDSMKAKLSSKKLSILGNEN